MTTPSLETRIKVLTTERDAYQAAALNTAMNYTVENDKLTSERDALHMKLAQQAALVEKCMVAINENADLGKKAEAERNALRADALRYRWFSKQIVDANMEALEKAFSTSGPTPKTIKQGELDALIDAVIGAAE